MQAAQNLLNKYPEVEGIFCPNESSAFGMMRALETSGKAGKVKFVGVSGYPMKMFRYVADRAPLDVILSYNHYTLQNTMLADLVPYLKQKGVGVMNA